MDVPAWSRSLGNTPEVKRMFVAQSGRGKGIGKRLLDAIIGQARTLEVRFVRLETGIAPTGGDQPLQEVRILQDRPVR